MKKVLAVLGMIALTIFAATMPPKHAAADVQVLTGQFLVSGTGATYAVQLGGQASCSFTASGSAAGLSTTVQISPDNVNWVTSGVSSAITGAGTSGGTLSIATIPVPLAMRLNTTALTSGTETIVYTCGGAAGGTGGGGSVTQGTSPWVVGLSATPLPVSGSFSASTTGNFPVTNTPTPFPAATTAPLSIDANNNLSVNVQAVRSPLPVNVTVTPGVTVQNTPGVTIQNTPAVIVQNATPATPLPTNSPGLAPTAAPVNISEDTCYFGSTLPAASAGVQLPLQCGPNGGLMIQDLPQSLFPPTLANVSPSTATTTLLGPSVASATLRTWFEPMYIQSAVTEVLTIETSAAAGCTTPTTIKTIPIIPGPNVIFASRYALAANTYLCMVTGAAGQVNVDVAYRLMQ